jgi:5-methyltetrahydrofolate--homocysteine methyltransferase
LLIGGATTSRIHTAVKIAPNYGGVTVYVPDASRAVGVASNLLSDALKDGYVAEVAADYERLRVAHASKKGPTLVTLDAARCNAFQSDWVRDRPAAPRFIGRRELRNVNLAELAQFIDWGPFFQTWELAGPFPAILEDPLVGEAARNVFAEGQAMLQQAISGRWLTANGVFGLYPAGSVGDDIVLYTDEARNNVAMTWRNLRQQNERPPGKPNYCLADFVAPASGDVPDYVGAFAVTAGLGIERKIAEFEAKQDDYNAIMLKAIADRLAEAFAEWLHYKVRREYWGYEAQDANAQARDQPDVRALIREEYRGIRPAPGYPACPDHTAKAALFALLDAPSIGMTVTENYAMQPTAAVAGFYLAHPHATYFAVGKIAADQAADVAQRSGWSMDEAQRWLAPNLR